MTTNLTMEAVNHLEQSKVDHELLIRIDEQVKIIVRDVKEMKSDLMSRVAVLETSKLSKEEANRLLSESVSDRKELRNDVESLKMWRSLMMGGLAVISMLVIPLVIYVFNLTNKLDVSVKQGVVSALSEYSVQVK